MNGTSPEKRLVRKQSFPLYISHCGGLMFPSKNQHGITLFTVLTRDWNPSIQQWGVKFTTQGSDLKPKNEPTGLQPGLGRTPISTSAITAISYQGNEPPALKICVITNLILCVPVSDSQSIRLKHYGWQCVLYPPISPCTKMFMFSVQWEHVITNLILCVPVSDCQSIRLKHDRWQCVFYPPISPCTKMFACRVQDLKQKKKKSNRCHLFFKGTVIYCLVFYKIKIQ